MHGSVRDFVNFMAFFGCFLDAPPPTQSLTPSFFDIWKVFRWYISGSSFIYAWVVVPKFLNFKCFHSRRKFDFRLLLGGFLYVTSWNVVKFIWYFEQWCNAKQYIRYVTVFIQFQRNGQNWAKKLIFWLISRGFSFTPSYALLFTPQSPAKLKVLWRCITVVSFITVAFVVAKFYIFKCFGSSRKLDVRLLLGGFLARTVPNSVRFFLKLGPVMQCKVSHHLCYSFWYSP